jgi:hypothetical protein
MEISIGTQLGSRLLNTRTIDKKYFHYHYAWINA